MRAMVATTWRSGSTFLGRHDHLDDYDDHHLDIAIQPTKYWFITNLLNLKQEQIVLERSARLNVDPWRGDQGDGGDG